MSVENKVPAIRFEGFSGEWEDNIVGNLCDFIVPGRNKPQKFGGDIPWITTPDIISNCVSESKTGLAITKEEAKRVGAKIVPKNSIIISCVGDLGLVAQVDNELIINQQLHAFIPKEKISKWFLLYGLGIRKKYMENIATKTAVPYMNKDNCNSIPVIFPSMLEQTKIGNYFQQLDTLIAQHQQKHDKLLNLKKTLLEKLFPQQGQTKPAIRFKGFSGEWEEKALGVLGDTYTGLSGKTKDDFGHGQGRFVTYMNVFSNTISNQYLTEPVEIDSNQNEVESGDVFFTTSSETPEEVGMSSVWVGEISNVYLNSFCFGYRPKQRFDYYYLAYMLRASSFRKQITFLAQGISRYNISKKKAMDIVINVPEVKEQTKIGNLFKQLDTLINQHQAQLNKLANIKQACLAKMFV